MPMSAVCISSVSNPHRPPRLWSSQTNIRSKDLHDVQNLVTMNSTEEIASLRDFYYPISKRSTLSHNYPDKNIKKESKKWSLGSLFRRKKKDESESSSGDEEERKRIGFLGRRRRKRESKRPKHKTAGGFDHIVLSQSNNSYNHHEDTGIFSDPSGGFCTNYSKPSFPILVTRTPSGESKKRGRELIKARAVARRTTLGGSSSEEEDSSLRSNSSLRVQSDENLHHNRRSRAARTERYLKRHSRDGENPHNYLRLSKSDADRSPSRSPLPRKATIATTTIPPNHGKYLVSNSTSNPSYKPPLSMNEYNNAINKSRPLTNDGIRVLRPTRQPPQPPPRDPKRTVMNHYFDNNSSSRPSTMHFDSPSVPSKKPIGGNFHSFSSKDRSTSEVHIPDPIRTPIRPASTTPEPKHLRNHDNSEDFNYLADKKPRSRKPIIIQPNQKIDSPTQKALDFWKQIEENVSKTLNAPQIFTSQTHVQSQVFIPRTPSPFKPVSPAPPLSHISKDDVTRKSSNLEEALDELEAIYNSLRLGDENLLDRAEQKENETLAKRAEEMKVKQQQQKKKGLSESFSYESFAKKKSKIPDTKEDDMYNRKLVKEKSATISDPQAALAKVSYLMNTPMQQAYDSEGEMRKIKIRAHEPDITFDDLGYRNVKRANASPKTVEPQPPFGIPLGPVTPAPHSDYLHATPSLLYYPEEIKKLPDVVKDDLAFRNLRKDSNKEPVLKTRPLDLNYLKKRRAVRSLSANIGNILHKDDTLTDIADAMEIARKVLQEKGKNINETRKGFKSDSEVKCFRVSLPTESATTNGGDCFNGSRLKLKASSDLKKPQDNSSNSSLDDLLNSLTEEAKIALERFTLELNELETLELERKQQQGVKLQKAKDQQFDATEVAEELKVEAIPVQSANIIQSCFKDSSEESRVIDTEPDYETIDSDMDKTVTTTNTRQSPFQERKDEIIASFQQLKEEDDAKKTDSIYENVEDKYRSHSRLRKWLRPLSCPDEATMSETTDKVKRSSRVARYKEERRKQLAEQFGHVVSSSSGSDGIIRSTRASRLRAQANNDSPKSKTIEKGVSPTVESPRTSRLERDKSSKRKSNLNRSLTSEVVPTSDDPKSIRKRRRFFPKEVFEQSPTTSLTQSSPVVSTPTTANSQQKLATPPRRSELSIHMENARKGIVTPSSTFESHKYKPFALKRSQTAHTSKQSTFNDRERKQASDSETNKNIAKRMEELTAFTRETLARVERLANRSRDINTTPNSTSQSSPSSITRPSSILKRSKSRENNETPPPVGEHNVLPAPSHTNINNNNPISILKRNKVGGEENKTELQTPPVTFSPNVIDPVTTNRKQGILKKRRSLDESTVMRHRSCSPDVANKSSDSKSILKNQRRSSLEELRCLQSPDPQQIQGILKRKSSRNEEEDSPHHGILKRRSGASSAGSTNGTPHVSITTAVILAAAEGAEMILDPIQDPVKPILKKKSFSEEQSSYSDSLSFDGPKPILKKKSSTDTDDGDDSKPKRPILKLSRNVMHKEISGDIAQSGEGEVKPILKVSSHRADSPRPRLSFCANDEEDRIKTGRGSRRSHTICSGDFNPSSFPRKPQKTTADDDRDLKKARPLSVSELVKSFEIQAGHLGAVPKQKRSSSDRYRTQPVTSTELKMSRNLIQKDSQSDSLTYQTFASLSHTWNHEHNNINSSLSLTEGTLLSTSPFDSTIFQSVGVSPESPACHKTSSDSAFQSLGDGLELEEPTEEAEEEMTSLAEQMKNIAEEAKKKRRGLDVAERRGILKQSAVGPQISRRSRPDKEDEGISCNDSGSDSESLDRITTKGHEDTTSEGESSGSKEVRKIFRHENNKLNLNFKQQLEGCLSKSKSSSLIRSVGAKPCALKHEDPVGSCKDSSEDKKSPAAGLRRSQTHSAGAMPRTIADLRAKLQENGEKGWLKRVPLNNNSGDELKSLKDKNRYNDELIEKSLLAAKKDELDAAAKQWKSRVEKNDAEKFSVAGKMKEAPPTLNIPPPPPSGDKARSTPQPKRYKGREDFSSTPSSPEKNSHFDLTRSKSAISPIVLATQTSYSESPVMPKKVSIIKPDDDTFNRFFDSVRSRNENDNFSLNPEDLDAVPRHQSLLAFRKDVRIRRRQGGITRNPIKALAKRTDIAAAEYTEVIVGIAEREKKRLNIEKLAQNSDKALEALAGLASKEDFKSVALKKGGMVTSFQPWQELMLLQIKGRRHIQTRLVEPKASSVNEGDCYVLITPKALYLYTGQFSNVIEQSRAADVANHVQKTNDMGCTASKVHNVSNKDRNGLKKYLEEFWTFLGESSIPETVQAGHPDEDQTYESNILRTNMIYIVEDGELAPYEPYWGNTLKVEMLGEINVIVFDFGTEMYVWSGKNAPPDKKKLALKLAKDLWQDGYNYSDCLINPLNVAEALGERELKELPLKADKRPDWALFAKITQHRETVLFREKFLDWPDFSRVIRLRDEGLKRSSGSIQIKPCNVEEMLKQPSSPDLIVHNIHFGRGIEYFDEDTRRLFQYDTESIDAWRIMDNTTHEKLDETSIGQFYEGDCYIYSWRFRQTVKGRELNGGKPSKHGQTGREITVFFCWHGAKSSVNEKCTAAFLTVELDKENAPQIRVVQGFEPAAFLRLFGGSMVIHRGKRDQELEQEKSTRLFIVRGELQEEAYLMEVPLEKKSLRSRGSLVLFGEGRVTIWHGCKADKQKKLVAKDVVNNILKHKPEELNFDGDDVEVLEVQEGEETEEFLNELSGDREYYHSLLHASETYDFTPRLFKFESLTGSFTANEILCPHRSKHSTPYPFVQSELYNSSQPALYLFDNHYELWLWHGWWPENDKDNELNVDQTGSGAVRWQAERKAAMQTAINYWKKIHQEDDDVTKVVAYLIWAGLEPLEFQNLFPSWEVRDDAKQLNLQDGRNENLKVELQKELQVLSRTTYSLEEIMQRPLPDGVDPTQLEIYLSSTDFQELFQMTKSEWEELPVWKKTALKKEKGLF